MPQSSSAQAS